MAKSTDERAAPPCRRCGRPTPPAVGQGRGGLRFRRYCSDECQRIAQQDRRRAATANVPWRSPRVCWVCDTAFQPTRPGQRSCGGTCSRRRKLSPVVRRSCVSCGQHFESNQPHQRYCSRPCYSRRPRVGRHRSNPSGSTHRRRAAKFGVFYEYVRPLAVFDRDGWICGLCGGTVDRTLTWPHPRSASLDHVVPMSKGGPHVAANLQCAHLGCNLLANDKAVC